MDDKKRIQKAISVKQLYEIINNLESSFVNLKNNFAAKLHKHQAADIEGLHKVSVSGDYNDLENKPEDITVPNDTGDLTNNAGYLTAKDLPVYKGATTESSGKTGLTPQPKAGDNEKAFFGDGTYKSVVKRINGIEADKNGNIIVESFPVGFEYFTINPNMRNDSLPYFGEQYNRSDYPDLWKYIQTQGGYIISDNDWLAKAKMYDGNVPFYSYGDGVNTFRVPSVKCWLKAADRPEEIGRYLDAGLPNITGSGAGFLDREKPEIVTGAFYSNKEGYTSRDSQSWKQPIVAFDAARSNPIYGKSSTVRPMSIIGVYCVVAKRRG